MKFGVQCWCWVWHCFSPSPLPPKMSTVSHFHLRACRGSPRLWDIFSSAQKHNSHVSQRQRVRFWCSCANSHPYCRKPPASLHQSNRPLPAITNQSKPSITYRSSLGALHSLIFAGVPPPGFLSIMSVYTLLPVVRLLQWAHGHLIVGAKAAIAAKKL